jgi:hypothetical protein
VTYNPGSNSNGGAGVVEPISSRTVAGGGGGGEVNGFFAGTGGSGIGGNATVDGAGTAGAANTGSGGGGGSYSSTPTYFAGGAGGSGIVIIRLPYVPDGVIDCNDNNSAVWQNLTGYVDADGDGYTTGGAVQVCSGASLPTGYRAAANGNDCNDSNASVWQNLTGYLDADGDGYTVGSGTSVCSGSSVVWSAGSPYRAAATATDCNDTNTNNSNLVWASVTCYHDADNDGYGAGTAYNCMNNTSCASATAGAVGTGTPTTGTNFSSNNTDCCDSDNTAYPGETLYYNTKDACGSYDHDCSGGVSACVSSCASDWISSSYTYNGTGYTNDGTCQYVAGSGYIFSSWASVSSSYCGGSYYYIPTSAACVAPPTSCSACDHFNSGSGYVYCK